MIQPAQLDYEELLVDNEGKYRVDDTQYDYLYISSNIDRLLPASMRMDYLKIVNGVYTTRARKEEITNKISEIMEECGYEEG